jgi:hypothetical protein
MRQQFADAGPLRRQPLEHIADVGVYGSCPLSLAEWIKLMIAAARLPARRLPANNQFCRPSAMGRMRFST